MERLPVHGQLFIVPIAQKRATDFWICGTTYSQTWELKTAWFYPTHIFQKESPRYLFGKVKLLVKNDGGKNDTNAKM